MITFEQALTATLFHDSKIVGADGQCQRWRRNGRTKTWKREPTAFQIPVKHGLYGYGYITAADADRFHTAEDCTRH